MEKPCKLAINDEKVSKTIPNGPRLVFRYHEGSRDCNTKKNWPASNSYPSMLPSPSHVMQQCSIYKKDLKANHFVPSPSSPAHTITNCVSASPVELESNPNTSSHQNRTQSHTSPDHLSNLSSIVLTSNLRSITCLHPHTPTTPLLIENQSSSTLILIITPLRKPTEILKPPSSP